MPLLIQRLAEQEFQIIITTKKVATTMAVESIKSIGIVGNGVVGHATARTYVEHYDVRVYDIISEKSPDNLQTVMGCDLIFVCLPTPQREGHNYTDTSALYGFFDAIGENEAHLVLKSTVAVGTTAHIAKTRKLPNLIHSPEFLTARCAVTDAHLPTRNIVGGSHTETGILLRDLYQDRFPGIPVIMCSRRESECIKLMQNAFFATKISFFNEMYQFAMTHGLSWDLILEGLLLDGRIAHSHTQVPGPDGKFGFGGECLPKDLANLIACLNHNLVSCDILEAVQNRNKQDRKREEQE